MCVPSYALLQHLEAKIKGEKERYKHLNAEFQRIARRDKKAFFSVTGWGIDLDYCAIEWFALETNIRDIVQETGIKTIPMEKKCKKAKWLSGRTYK